MFPEDFKLGFSISGFQSEMGLSDNDEHSDWWKWVHDINNIKSGLVSGDLPENGVAYWDLYDIFHTFAEDIGMNTARLGIEWSRIFPETTSSVEVTVKYDQDDIVGIDLGEEALKKMDEIADKRAVEHYANIFRNVKERGMQLIINAYHWPIPLALHDPVEVRENGASRGQNGWLDHTTVIEFVKYASYVAWKFGEFADMMSVMNEPNIVLSKGYINIKSGFPPSFGSKDAALLVKKHIIEACGRGMENMKKLVKCPVGLIFANSDIQPLTPDDQEAADQAKYDDRYSFFDALMHGDFSWLNTVDNGSKFVEKGSLKRKDMRISPDWIGVNYYTRAVVQKVEGGYRVVPGYGFASTAGIRSLGNREVSDFGWEIYPDGLYNLLKDYHEKYGLEMIVTENGIADRLDSMRPTYLVSHIKQVERALNEGVNVRGYLHWSLVDNYEWSSGFSMKFGLSGFDPRTKKIQIRPSAYVFREIARNHGVPEGLDWMVMS